MKKKLIVALVGMAVLGGTITTAFADTISTAPNNTTKVEHQEVAKNHKDRDHESSAIRREDKVEKEVKAGKTVSEIKTEILANLKANLNKRVSEKKLDSQKADEIYNNKSKEIEKADILNGVVTNKYIKDEMNKGETLNTAKENFIKYKTENINKLVTDKKLTAEQGKEKIAKITERVNKNEGIFVNRAEQKEKADFIQSELKSGKTAAQIKEDLQSKLQDKLNTEVKDKKISSEKSEEIYKRASERIAKSDILNGVVGNKTIKETLNKGGTLSAAKEAYIKTKTEDINKLVTDKKITSDQGKTKIENLTNKINNNEGVFINY
ncbi:hypothetical protein [uncultured Clostridium sp.]|uniref:hypothetical protein n=1 Tax=uncultured Clostridium sp. TaxID=59620 RepID=UPI002613BB0D|nr:hypothetical protein [uncultured Clostridium sp.]